MDGTTPVLDVPSISYKDSLSVLSKAIRDTHHGVFILEDLPTAPFDEIQTAFDHLLGEHVASIDCASTLTLSAVHRVAALCASVRSLGLSVDGCGRF